MTILQGIILGAVQGIAEFLPISSSGHLKILQHFFALDEIPLLFDVLLHIATLFAVLIYFRKIIFKLFAVFFRIIFRWQEPKDSSSNVSVVRKMKKETLALAPNDEIGRKTIVAVILTTAVTGVIGIFSSKMIPDLPLKFISVGFVITAILLLISSRFSKMHEAPEKLEITDEVYADQESGISWKQAIVIGIAQGFGTLPGISRSGSTIAGAHLCGVKRNAAGDYSFLVSIPAILGAFVLELRHLDEMFEQISLVPMIAGCAAAFVFGYIALSIFMRIIRKGKLGWFAIYLIPLGIAGFIFF